MIWKTATHSLDLTHRAHIMGILNTTPDSFSDGGNFTSHHTALAHALEMISHGTTIIDIGGESSRPGALPVSPAEEIARTAPLIHALRAQWDGLISIDTTKASVAHAALTAGADIVNDISGLTADPEMPALCAASSCGIVIMHMQGTPGNMQENPTYQDVSAEIRTYFQQRLATLTTAGIHPSHLCFDPGIGFGKTLAHNLTLLRDLPTLAPPGHPLLLGISRKSFLSKISNSPNPTDRDSPTLALTTLARQQGIMLHRVHDTQGAVRALRSVEALIET